MSQKQLADALGMSLRSVAAWEAGATVTPSVLKMLQQLLAGINLADLFRLTPADIASK